MSAAESLSQRAARSVNHPLTRTLLVLTFTTGLVDATSFLGLGHVFTANMTGNVVLLGFALAGGTGLPVVAPIVSLLAFLCGSGGGGALARRLASRHTLHVGVALGIEVTLLMIAAVLAAAVKPHPGRGSADTVIALLAFAMGVRTATVRGIAASDLSTTVLTMTLTELALESRLFGGSGSGTVRRSLAVVAMLVGAVVGALELKVSIALPLFTAAALALLTDAVYVPAARAESAGAQK